MMKHCVSVPQQGEEYYRLLIDNAPHGILACDNAGNIVAINPKFLDLAGLPSMDSARSVNLLSFQPMIDAGIASDVASCLSTGRHSVNECEYVSCCNKRIFIRYNLAPIRDDDGNVTGVQGIFEDLTERRCLEGAMRQSEEQFRALAEAASEAICILQDGQFRYVNHATEKISGYTKEELRSISFLKLIHPDEAEYGKTRCWDWQDMISNEAHSEIKCLRKGGDVLWADVSRKTISYEGRPALLLSLIDVTERKRAEEALRDNERFLNNVFDSITDGISMLDRDLNIIRVNRIMERWHPDAVPLVGKKCYSAYHHRSEPCMRCPSLKAIMEKTSQIGIVPREMTGNTVGWQEVHSYCMQDDDDNTIGVINYVRDITQRKLAEDALRESEEKFRVLAEASSTMIGLYQGDHFVYVNGAGERLTGYTLEQLMRMKFWDVVHPDDRDMVRDRGRLRQQGEKVTGNCEIKLLTRNGETRWAELTAGRILYRGKPAGIATFFDITERKRAEEQLALAKAEAELYLDLMCHDINNMNMVTMGYIEVAYNKLASGGTLTSADISLLEKALKSVQNSSGLIKNVQKLQQVRSGIYEPEVLDLGETLEEVVAQHGNVSGREVRINCRTNRGCHVRANSLLKDVFINLVGNAIKHSEGPLNINICISNECIDGQAYWKVIVEDDGPGIPDSQKKTLFDRLSLSTSRARGKGFGLCLIKMLIDDYRGQFRVEDRIPGDHTQGARFIVMLPTVDLAKP